MHRFVLVFVALLICVPTTQAQFSLGPHAGVSFSSFPASISEFYGTGFGFGAHANLGLLPFLGTRFSVDYWTFSSDKTKLLAALQPNNAGLTAVSGLNISVLSFYLDGKGKIPLGGTVTPYGLIGLGMNITSTSTLKGTVNGQEAEGNSIDSQTDFGLNFGAGADFEISAVTLFGEIKYVLIFTSGDSSAHIPIVVGASFGL